jgi:hypothetical protein
MSAKIELCFYNLLSKSSTTEEVLLEALRDIIEQITPIRINQRFEIDYFSSHMFAVHLIIKNPNAGDKLKVRCFRTMVDLHNRLRSIRAHIDEIEKQVLVFEKENEGKNFLKGQKIDVVRAYRTKTGKVMLQKTCVRNYHQALINYEKCLKVCESHLPNNADGELLKLLR